MSDSTTKDVANALYGTKFHRDGCVTIWNVYEQQWNRTNSPSDRLLASLPSDVRDKVVKHIAKHK